MSVVVFRAQGDWGMVNDGYQYQYGYNQGGYQNGYNQGGGGGGGAAYFQAGVVTG